MPREEDREVLHMKPESLVHHATWRHYMFYVIHAFQSIATAISSPVLSQYLYSRLNQQYFVEQNLTYVKNDTTSCRSLGHCYINKTTEEYHLQQKVQAITAGWTKTFSYASGIPEILVVLIVGSWMDVLGRKVVVSMNMIGHIVRYVTYALLMKSNLPTQFLVFGYFVEGCTGGFRLNMLISFAYTADITPKNYKRALLIVVSEHIFAACSGFAAVGAGYFICHAGFFWPLILAIALLCLMLVLFIAIVPETITKRKLYGLSPKMTAKRLVRFYVCSKDKPERNEYKFWLCLLAFATLSLSVIGEFSIETLFILNSPFCWDSVKIANFTATMSFLSPIFTIFVFKLMQRWMTEELIGSTTFLFFITRCFMRAFATNDTEIYILENKAVQIRSSMTGSATKYTKLAETENLVVNLTWRHYSFFVIHFLRNVCYAMADPVMTQYVYAKLAEETIQNTSFSGGSTFQRGGNSFCSLNKSSEVFKLQEKVHAQAAFWSIYFHLVNGIPMVISIIFIGSWADVLGRIPITAYNMTGHILQSVLFAVVMHFNLPTAYLLIGYFFNGAAGGYLGNLAITCAYTADITEKGKQRGIFMLIVSNLSYLFYGLVNFGIGYIIKAIGFFWPMVISVLLSIILVVALVSVTAETLQPRAGWSELHLGKTISRVFGFYFKRSEEGGENVRLKFCLALLSFITLSQFVYGLWNLKPLYQLNSPFCWDSVKIGIFLGVLSIAQPALSTLILCIVQRWWSEEIIAVFGLFAIIIQNTFDGFAFKSWMLYLAGLIGAPGLLSFAMIRTIVSHLTDPSEQGSVFAGLGTVEALCGMTSSVMLNTIYAHTLLWMKGFVFIVVAISCVIPASLLLALHFVNKKEKSKKNTEISLDTNNTDSTASQEPEPTLNPAVNAAFEPIDKTF